MPTVESFGPILPGQPLVLVLGSMPGIGSLRLGQYYAHPRNAFWRIMADICGFDPGLPYRRRVARLKAARVAVWDVLGECRRAGSLDSAIARESEVPNPVAELLRAHPGIRLLAFNGQRSEEAFDRHVSRLLGPDAPGRVRLPSTSPAHAALTVAQKASRWREAILPALRP